MPLMITVPKVWDAQKSRVLAQMAKWASFMQTVNVLHISLVWAIVTVQISCDGSNGDLMSFFVNIMMKNQSTESTGGNDVLWF